jgi:hypothetical protein
MCVCWFSFDDRCGIRSCVSMCAPRAVRALVRRVPSLPSVPKPSKLEVCVCVCWFSMFTAVSGYACRCVRRVPFELSCERSEEDSIRESAMPTPVYLKNANLLHSRIPSTPSLLPNRDLPAVSIPTNYAFMTFNYSFVTGTKLSHAKNRGRP